MNSGARHDDEKLDETLDETFPASDSPANTVETGIQTSEITPVPPFTVSDNRSRSRFELTVDGHTAFLEYERAKNGLTLIHTEVPKELRGRHIGDALVEAALDAGRSEGRPIVAVCPFVRKYMQQHPRA